MAKKSTGRQSTVKSNLQAPDSARPALSPTGDTGKKSVSGKSRWLPLAIATVIITALCYLPSLSNGLVNWDDDPNIIENPNLKYVGKGAAWPETIRDIFSIEKGAVIGNYNPLAIFTFALEKAAAGGEINPTLIHVDSLLLHLLTVFLVFKLLLALGISKWGATLGSLLFGIHPMRVESVAWATERKDVLFAVFFFMALIQYVKWLKADVANANGGTDKSRRMWLYVSMLILATLSLFSKVQAVTLPLSMLAIDYLLKRRMSFRLLWEKTPFWVLSLIFGLVNLYTLSDQGSMDEIVKFSLPERFCIGMYSFLVYLYKLVIPFPMSPLYPYPRVLPLQIYLAPIGFALILLLFIRALRKKQHWPAFGLFFFFVNVMFLLQVVGAGQGFLADRFTYVAYFGLFALAARAYDHFWATEKFRAGMRFGLGALLLVFGAMTVTQSRIWENGGTLWSHVIEREGESSALPFWNRGQYLRKSGDFDAALQDYDLAVKISPANPDIRNSRGKTLFDLAMKSPAMDKKQKLTMLAIADFDSALSRPVSRPKSRAEFLINRGTAYASAQRFDAALRDLSEGIKLDSTGKNGYSNRALLFMSMEQFDKAIADFSAYIRYDANNADIWYQRGMLHRYVQANKDAVSDLSRALQLNPGMGIAYLERARAHIQQGDIPSGQQDYRAAQKNGVQLAEQDLAALQAK